MKTEDVLKLSPEQRFWYWCRERHQVYLKKRAGKSKPWTDDKILQSYYFTNPYRENDKVTVWFRENVRDPLRDDPRVIFATIAFRWFNLPATGIILNGRGKYAGWSHSKCFLCNWDQKAVLDRLGREREAGRSIFTGAYMINSPPGKPKLEAICERIDNVWRDRKSLAQDLIAATTLREAHGRLTVYPGLGDFYAYEIVCDLRYTSILEDASDVMSWCNPGPGAIRGMYRILGREIKNKSNATSPPKPPEWGFETSRLLALSQLNLRGMPKFEMREIEHSLCEYDKYTRLLLNEGRSKRKYNGT